MAGAGRSPRGSRGPLHRSRSFDPDPDLRAAIDMGMFGGLGPGGGGGGGGAPMPPGYGHGHYGGFGPPGAGPAMAAAPRPGYLTGYPPGYGPAYPYQHHQQLVHRPNLHGPDLEAERAPSKCGMFWRYVWKLSSCLCSHITLVSLVVAYCLLGALTFEKLESSNEVMVKTNISYRRSNVTQWLWMMTSDTDVLRQDNWTLEAIERLKIFEQELLWAMRSQGWDGIEDASKLQWTFLGALFYSIIVITTIGYGHIAPKTNIGKVVTIFYAILGIPLMLLCLSNIGDVMAQSFRFLYWRVCCFVCTRQPQPSSLQRRSTGIARSRMSSRSSRMASFRRSGRVSTRSADAVMHGGHLAMRASHSDTECRYPDEEREMAYRGASLGPPSVSHQRFQQEMERMPSAREGQRRLRSQSVGREGRRRGPWVGPPGGSLPRQHRVGERGPVRDSLKSSQRSSGYGSAHGPHRRHHPELAPSPRIMSPMGFGMNRNLFRSMAEDGMDMDLDMDMGWEGGGGGSAAAGGPDRLRPVPIWLCVFLVVSYIFGGAFLFAGWEKWSFLDSAYFCFITLTTIGFGDFVPAQRVQNNASVSIALCSLYLLFGIALLAMSFNLVQEEVINSVRAVARRLGIIKAEPEDD